MAFNSHAVNVKQYIHEHGIYDVIGDIHGCFDELIELLVKLEYTYQNGLYIHPRGRKLISIGDLNDRGPNSLKVIRLWMNLVENNLALYVYGNHCNKFYRYMAGRNVKITHGLENTVDEFLSLSVKEQESFRQAYIRFYESQSYYWILDEGRLIVSHAGLKEEWIGKTGQKMQSFCLYGDITGKTDEAGHPIRKDWAKDYDGSSFIVYGHTPVLRPIILHETADIDQGCVFGGNLTAFRYPEREFVQVPSKQPVVEEQMKRMIAKYEELVHI